MKNKLKPTKVFLFTIIFLLSAIILLSVSYKTANASFIEGTVSENDDNQVQNALIELYNQSSGELINSTNSGQNGYFSIISEESNITIDFVVTADNYYTNDSISRYIQQNENYIQNFTLFETPEIDKKVYGYVNDEQTGEVIEQVNIFLNWTDNHGHYYNVQTTTNNQGFYSLNSSYGTIEMIANHNLFIDNYEIFEFDESDSIKWINFSMEIDPQENSPVADTGGPYSDLIYKTINFNGSNSSTALGFIENYSWDFGDGNTSLGMYSNHTYKKAGTYNVTLNVTNNYGLNGIDIAEVTILVDDTPPSRVTGLNVTNAWDGKLNLTWDETTDNVGIRHYNIYRDGDFLKSTNFSDFQDTNLTNDQTYSYQIEAVDLSGNTGQKSESKNGMPEPSNRPPIANAGGPYDSFFVGEKIIFDASNSSDPNEDVDTLRFYWKFGDGFEALGQRYLHTYTERKKEGYTVTLIVIDSGGLNNTTKINVRLLNRKPSTPDVESDLKYAKSKEAVRFNLFSSDPDNDMVRFYVDWGDGSQVVTENVTSNKNDGSTINLTHNWSKAGKYVISVKSYDGENYSKNGTLIFYIDSIPIDDIIHGYLIDNNNDGMYDLFYNEETDKETSLLKMDDEKYRINYDGDGDWDYIYDVANDELEDYVREKDKIVKKQGLPLAIIIFIAVTIIVSLVVFLIFYSKQKEVKRKKEKIEEKINQYDAQHDDVQYIEGGFQKNNASGETMRYRVERIPNNSAPDFNPLEEKIY